MLYFFEFLLLQILLHFLVFQLF